MIVLMTKYSSVDISSLAFSNISRILGLLYSVALVSSFIYISIKEIKTYLYKLKNALNEMASNQSSILIEYDGPKEFQEIYDSFNKMSRSLDKANKERRIAEDTKQKIISDLAHDLKTPLTSIGGYAQAIRDGVIPKQDIEEYAGYIYDRSIQMTELVSLMNIYNKLSHPEFKLNRKRMNFSEYLINYIDSICFSYEEKGYRLNVSISEDNLFMNMDNFHFDRVLDNLLGNIVKYNQPPIAICISLYKSDYDIVLEISDNGKGIQHDMLDMIFEPFIIEDQSRTSGSHGLGLSIVKKIITLHGGKIIAEDNDPGLKIKITLPSVA